MGGGRNKWVVVLNGGGYSESLPPKKLFGFLGNFFVQKSAKIGILADFRNFSGPSSVVEQTRKECAYMRWHGGQKAFPTHV